LRSVNGTAPDIVQKTGDKRKGDPSAGRIAELAPVDRS
jgi:hypothetical protein